MLTFVLADDHQIFRDAVRELLEQQAGTHVVGEAGDGLAAVDLARATKPDIVLMDLAMPSLSGIEATRKITSELPDTRVICLSMHSEEKFVRAMFDAGASGYLLKVSAVEELFEAIEKALDGKMYVSRSIRDKPDKPPVANHAILDSAFDVLTSRERQVTQLYSEGATTKEIASELDVSIKTVGTHRQHIMRKLNLNGIAELTRYAVREGLTKL